MLIFVDYVIIYLRYRDLESYFYFFRLGVIEFILFENIKGNIIRFFEFDGGLKRCLKGIVYKNVMFFVI